MDTREIDKVIKEVREQKGRSWSFETSAQLTVAEAILILAKVINESVPANPR